MTALQEMTETEVAKLQTIEKRIKEGLQDFIAVGNCLAKIRDEKLYRQDHKTFESYLKDRWDISKSYGHRLIAADKVSKNVSPVGDKLAPNERQARELGRLEPEQQREVWDDLTGDGETPALADVKKKVAEVAEPKTRSHNAEQLASSKSEEHYTPEKYVSSVRNVLGHIELDPASCKVGQDVVGAERFFTKDDDGLEQSWSVENGGLWLNPPYNGKTSQWVNKAISEWASGAFSHGILLVSAAPWRKWFQDLWGYPICFTDHQIHFRDESGVEQENGAMLGSAFAFLCDDQDDWILFEHEFRKFGHVILPR